MSTPPEVSAITVTPALPSAPEAVAARAWFCADVSAAMGVTWHLPVDADGDLAGPDGAFWLARSVPLADGAEDDDERGRVLGCVGARAVQLAGGQAVEVKRLWVSSAARGLGLGTRLYRRTGWTEVTPYNDNTDAQLWFSKPLG